MVSRLRQGADLYDNGAAAFDRPDRTFARNVPRHSALPKRHSASLGMTSHTPCSWLSLATGVPGPGPIAMLTLPVVSSMPKAVAAQGQAEDALRVAWQHEDLLACLQVPDFDHVVLVAAG